MGKSLLLADDSVTIQKVVGISFASEDIEIHTVDNGDDAVARARELQPDIILADVVMPGRSGYEVCEAVKAEPALAHVPVVLLTGTFEAFDADRASRVGAAGHVSKPFEAQTLVDRVRELLEAAPAPAAPAANPPPPPVEKRTQAFDFSDEAEDFPEATNDPMAEPLEFDDSDAAFSFEEEELGAPEAPRQVPHDATAVIPVEAPPAAAPVEPRDLAQATTLLDPDAARGYDVSSSDLGDPAKVLGADPVLARLQGQAGAEIAPEAVPVRPYGAAEPTPPEPAPVPELQPDREPSQPLPPVPAPEPRVEAAVAPTPMPEPDPEPEVEPMGALEPVVASLPVPEPVVEPVPAGPSIEAAPEALDPAPEEGAPEPPLEVGPPAVDAGWPGGAELEPGAVTDPFPADVPGPEPVSFPAAEAAEAEDAPEPRSEPEPAPEQEPALAEPATDGPPPIDPELLRRELAETLERIAWDAFGPVTEKIVQQSLERLEQVIWEVVPQLAETLIQEEIRKLKEGR